MRAVNDNVRFWSRPHITKGMAGADEKVMVCLKTDIVALCGMLCLQGSLCHYFADIIFYGNYFMSASIQLCIAICSINVPHLARASFGVTEKTVAVASAVLSAPNAVFMVLANESVFGPDGNIIGNKRDVVFALSVSAILFILHMALTAKLSIPDRHGRPDGGGAATKKLHRPIKL